MDHQLLMQPVETDNEVAKREALVEALTTFCNVVRKTRRNSPEGPELLNSAGKLSMEHIIPVYRVSRSCVRMQNKASALQSVGCLAVGSVRSIWPHIAVLPKFGPGIRLANAQCR